MDSYKLIHALGNGSMGTVFLGLFLEEHSPPAHKHQDDGGGGGDDDDDGGDDGRRKLDDGGGGGDDDDGHGDLHVSSHHHGLYALKVMSKEEIWRKGVEKRASMEREVLMACSSAHGGAISPFLPSLKDHFESETHRVLVLDYCPGGDLNQLRSRHANNRFPEDEARYVWINE
jgi:serine/threonine protein kinase